MLVTGTTHAYGEENASNTTWHRWINSKRSESTALSWIPVLGNVPEQGDFLTVMRSDVDNLRKAFEMIGNEIEHFEL